MGFKLIEGIELLSRVLPWISFRAGEWGLKEAGKIFLWGIARFKYYTFLYAVLYQIEKQI